MGKERDPFLNQLPKRMIFSPIDTVRIGKRSVGMGCPVFVIAEVGSNHRGKIENAFRSIEIAARAGADAVKFQHLRHNTVAADAVVRDEWHGKPIGELSGFYKSAELPYEWTEKLVAHARKHNIIFLSTPFDKEAVNVLDNAGIPVFKVASYELTDDILLRYIAKKKKPIILSTGMAYLEEVARAVRLIREEENNKIVLLHCVSLYPPKSFTDLNLAAIKTLREAFKLPVGFSDHSAPPSVAAALGAVSLGACVVEKHFTDGRSKGSNDDPNSLEPKELDNYIAEIRNLESALSGSGVKQPVCYPNHKNDEVFERWARRSLHAAVDIPKGTVITRDMIIALRPWGGIETQHLPIILGKKTVRTIKARSPIVWEDLLQR